MNLEQFKQKLYDNTEMFSLFKNQDLFMNKNFEIYFKERKNNKPHISINETIIIPAIDESKILNIILKDAIQIIFAKNNVNCLIPDDIYNREEKDLEDKNKRFLKYEKNLKLYQDEIVEQLNLIKVFMLKELVDKIYEIHYLQILYRLGYSNAEEIAKNGIIKDNEQ